LFAGCQGATDSSVMSLAEAIGFNTRLTSLNVNAWPPCVSDVVDAIVDRNRTLRSLSLVRVALLL
jgi:hypothetical protein